jgi:hypothetical protein
VINDGFDRRVYDPAAVHVDLDVPTAKSFIFRSVLSFLAGFFFASIRFLPRPVESRTLPEVVGLDSLSERPDAELPARTCVAPGRTSFGGVPVIRQH